MSKFRYISKDALDTIKVKENLPIFIFLLKENPNDSDWLKNWLGMNPFVSSSFECSLQFKIAVGEPESYDFENAIRLYKAFKAANLSNAIIYDERFMVGLILDIGYQYFLWRCPKDKNFDSHIEGALFFQNGPRRAIARNFVGRLYQWVCLTVDESADDPYELTKFAFDNPATLRLGFFPSLDNHQVNLAYFRALKQWKDSGHKLPAIDKLLKHFRLLCLVNVAEAMDEEDIIVYLHEYLESTLSN